MRGEIPISELCRREGIAPTLYYRWSKAFMDAGKNGLTRDTQRDATTEEARSLKEDATLKKALAESILFRYPDCPAQRSWRYRHGASRVAVSKASSTTRTL